MLKRQYRLPLSKKPFTGKRISVQGISLVVSENDLDHSRAAVIVSKKISKKAVERNRLKRQILNSIRPFLDEAPFMDILLLPTKAMNDTSFEQIDKKIHECIKKLQKEN